MNNTTDRNLENQETQETQETQEIEEQADANIVEDEELEAEEIYKDINELDNGGAENETEIQATDEGTDTTDNLLTETGEQNEQQEQKDLGELKASDFTSERAMDRFLELSTQRNQYKQQYDEVRETITQAIPDPDQLNNLLTYSQLVGSGDPINIRQAIGMLDTQRQQLSIILGEDVEGSDVLSAYPDLQDRANNLEIDRDTALEMARLRMISDGVNNYISTAQQEQEQINNHNVVTQAAHQQLVALEERWKSVDPDYKAKIDIIMPKIESMIGSVPPEQWPQQIELMYNLVGETADKQRMVNPTTPLTNADGVTNSARPKTVEEAVLAELGLL